MQTCTFAIVHNPEAEDFGKCKVAVKEYAELTGLKTDDLYQELPVGRVAPIECCLWTIFSNANLHPRNERRGGEGPAAIFTTAYAVTTEGFLRYEPAKHFLGVVNAQIQEETLDHGRNGRFALGGLSIVIPADGHACKIRPEDRVRSCILPNLLGYPERDS
jgi:hypothetical protein